MDTTHDTIKELSFKATQNEHSRKSIELHETYKMLKNMGVVLDGR